MDHKAIQEVAGLFMQARRSGELLESLPEACRPATVADAHAIQHATIEGLGERIGGWKVALQKSGEVLRGAIFVSRILESPASVPASRMPLLGVEAEIAFRFDRDLPPRDREYTKEEVSDAVTALVAIEIVDSRFRNYKDTPLMHRAADCVSNGGLVRGTVQPSWRERDLSKLEACLKFDGQEIVRRVGGHPQVDPLLPAIALVNDLRRGGGVRAGQIATTGTYTGLNFAKPGQRVDVVFEQFGSAAVQFEK